MSRAAPFTKNDVKRALMEASEAGVTVAVFIERTGRLAIIPTSVLPLIDMPSDVDARLDEFGAL